MSLSNILSFFKKKDPVIKFKSLWGDWSVCTPVIPVNRFKTKWQQEQSKESSIVHCPGMHDYLSSGYIISSHVDFRIKATKVGTKILITSGPAVESDLIPHQKLNHKYIQGVFNPEGVKLEVNKIPLPWYVSTPKGYSVYALPWLLQADYLDDIKIWPGVVDTDEFHIMNVIFSAKREGEFFIPAGTPLLHIIPFKREVFNGECGKATEEESDIYKYSIVTKVGQYYRRFFHTRKKFNMTGSVDHRFLNK